ncbi:phage major capsid protein [Roseomonas indoligenes]|uniref:Phage major capsid protein n=1 Tax=Roseomonas indoligenes TaxID=2820811 RepID=A0A940MY90_9PROT|nr:phage major capsid protein [Pararoseomonas indoligenes]MBP0493044.1 phage major capsid protein [Pararoseomonas indoligenes]
MDRITALRAAQAANLDQMEALLATAHADGERDLTAEEKAAYAAAQAEDDRLVAAIGRETDAERRRAAAAKPLPGLPGGTRITPTGATVPAAAAEPLQPGIAFSRITQALILGDMDQRAAASIAEERWGSDFGQVVGNMEQSTTTKGGFLVDTRYASDFIDLLRPTVAVRAMGAREIPLPGGNLTTRKKTAGSAAAYVGERQAIPTTDVRVGQMTLSAKKLAAIVPIMNELLRRPSRQVDEMVREDLRESVAITEDQQFLRGVGSATAPTGARYLAAAANVFAANATINLQNVTNDLAALRLKLLTANIPMSRAGYIISWRTAIFLETLLDGNGNKAFPEISQGRIGPYPFRATNSVPTNLGAGSNESEIYFADWAQMVIGDEDRLTIAASDVASYVDTDGVTRSAFQNDETLIRVIEHHDTGVRYDQAIAVLTGVKWGA